MLRIVHPRAIVLIAAAFTASLPAFGNGIVFSCAANVDSSRAGTCNDLNTTVAGLYSSSFIDANANIYIQFAGTGLGSSTQYISSTSYANFYSALQAVESSPNDITAVNSLGSNSVNPVVGGDGVSFSSALGTRLGLGGTGIDTAQGFCTLGTGGCYNGLITIGNNLAGLYFRTGGQAPGTYDFFTVVEHEVDEVLGSSSCLVTAAGPANGCGSNVGAVDLFRYGGVGTRSFLSTASGTTAYFSIDGGVTNIADYNNSPNNADYGDWDGALNRVQNAFGSPSTSGVDIVNDGGSELMVLDAIGYTQTSQSTPEPGTFLLFGSGLGLFAGRAWRKRRP